MASRVLSTIVCGGSCSLSISNDGDVYSIGTDRKGALGSKENRLKIPTKISSVSNIIAIDFGTNHTICLDINGSVFTIGSNQYGQLGLGKDGNGMDFTHEAKRINLPPIKQISCGSYFNVCLSEDDKVFSFGDNRAGQLGLGNFTPQYSPMLVESLENINIIECGGNHTAFVCFDNTVFVCGINDYGQLGLGHTDKQNIPTIGMDYPKDEIVDIKCGYNFTLVLTSNQEVYSCGYNYFGQLGKNSSGYCTTIQKIEGFSEIVRIGCGSFHSICIDMNRNLYTFGYNNHGQLGLGDTNNRKIPIKHPELSNIVDISSGGYHTFVKTGYNEIYAFGSNDALQLGVETENKAQTTPIRVFVDNEDIWCSNLNASSRVKSARK